MTTPPVTRSPRRPLLLIAAVVVLAAAGLGLWYLFFRPSGPAPVSLGSTPSGTLAVGASAVAEASTDPSVDAESSAPASADPPTGAGAGDGIAGTWTVDPSVGSFDDFSGSFVGYRVREELASVGATEAVGRTPNVTGTLTVDGTMISAAEFTADLTTLQSDEGNRDRQLRRQGLETGTYPTATFTLTKPIELGAAPAEGQTIQATAGGDLTIHGTTKAVAIPVQAKLENGVVTVVGSLPIAFADYGMQKPQAMIVLSVEDNGTMEFQLQFTKA